MGGTSKVGILCVHDLPCSKSGSVGLWRTGRAVGEETVNIVISPGILECVLGEVIRSLLNIWIVRAVSEVPSSVLNGGSDTCSCRGRIGQWGRSVKLRIGAQMGPQGRVGPEQSSHLLQVSQKRRGLVVVGESTEHVQSGLAVTQEPVLLHELAGGGMSVAHDNPSICDVARVGPLDQPVLGVLAGRIESYGTSNFMISNRSE